MNLDLFTEPTIAHVAAKIKRQNLASQLALQDGDDGGMEVSISQFPKNRRTRLPLCTIPRW